MFIEVPVSSIHEDPRFPDVDTHYIYDHLKYLLSKPSPFPLPAVGVRLLEGRLVLTSRHKYLFIARELGAARIRARMQGVLPGQLPAGARPVPPEELEAEDAIGVVRGHHVYFFERPLTPSARQEFHRSIVGFFERLQSPLLEAAERRVWSCSFPFEGRCAELEATIPVGDQSWMSEYLRVSGEFSRSVARIVSFQGGRFPQSA